MYSPASGVLEENLGTTHFLNESYAPVCVWWNYWAKKNIWEGHRPVKWLRHCSQNDYKSTQAWQTYWFGTPFTTLSQKTERTLFLQPRSTRRATVNGTGNFLECRNVQPTHLKISHAAGAILWQLQHLQVNKSPICSESEWLCRV